MKVYLDDVRPAPPGWINVKTANEAIGLLRTGQVTEISLDHDLGDPDTCGTGYDVICWIEEQVYTNNFSAPEIHIHTANTAAGWKMEQALVNIRKHNT